MCRSGSHGYNPSFSARYQTLSVKFGLALDFWSTTKPLHQLLDDYAGLLEIAEGYGFDSVWAGEQGRLSSQPGHVPSPLLVLASLARSTHLRLGTGVTLLMLWHPLRLAHDVAVLDQISAGRFTLGAGVGNAEAMRRYGIPTDGIASRMDEALRLLKSLWSGAEYFKGEYFTVEGRLCPPPVQPGGPPIWIGGRIGRSVQRAAELGDGWYGATQHPFDLIKKQSLRYRELLSQQGRDPASATVVINRTAFLAETDEQARRESKPYVTELLDSYSRLGLIRDSQGVPLQPSPDLLETVGDTMYFVGGPESCLKSVRKYHQQAGVSQINFRVSMADLPLEWAKRTVTLLGEEVLPRIDTD